MKRIVRPNATKQEEIEDLLKQTVRSGDCLEWVRCFNTDGYPRMAGNVKVHRRIYEISSGLDIAGLVVRHKCDNPRCINPEHLSHGTQSDNVSDRDSRGRTFRKITPEIIARVKDLLQVKILSNNEIADIVGIDYRRVSDISNGLYSDDGKFFRRGIRRF